MSFIIVDVESDGPVPADFSMVGFGAVLFDDAKGNAVFKECGIEVAVTPSDMADALLRSAKAKGVTLS